MGRGDGSGPGSYHSLRAILRSNTRMEPSPSPATISERWESQDRLVTQLSAPVGISWGQSTQQPSWDQHVSPGHCSQGPKPDGPRVLLLFLSPPLQTHPRFPPVTRTRRRGRFSIRLSGRDQKRRVGTWGRRSLCLSHQSHSSTQRARSRGAVPAKPAFANHSALQTQREAKSVLGRRS